MTLPQTSREMLAIAGGTPVRPTLLPYGRQSIEQEDIDTVVAVLRSDWITTGPKIQEFEEAFASEVQARYAISFSSGTAALHAAAAVSGLENGDEAIVAPLTFCASANCVLYAGARPVFADVCPDSLNLDPDAAARRCTSRTRAIIAVDYAGHPADIGALRPLAESHGALLIEDACHALGATFQKKRVGGLAHMTVFSFHPVKHITTGEGGMVTTNDAELAAKLRVFRSHGIASDARMRQASGAHFYDMVSLGYNYRLTDISCALGLSQLRRLGTNVQRRREVAEIYRRAFAAMPAVTAPIVRDDVEPAWHLYPIRLKLDRLNGSRDDVFAALRAENIGVNVHYLPVHLHSYYRQNLGTGPGDMPVAEQAYRELISLPMFHGITDRDIADVVQAVGKVVAYYAR